MACSAAAVGVLFFLEDDQCNLAYLSIYCGCSSSEQISVPSHPITADYSKLVNDYGPGEMISQ